MIESKLFLTLLFVSLIFSNCGGNLALPTRVAEPANVEAGEVGFELAGPGGAAIVVPVLINGEGPFNFVLDTGATITCIDRELVNRLKLPEQRGQIGIGAGVKNQGNVQLIKVNSLQVGSAKAENLNACTLDLQHIRGIGLDANGLVGLNFLKSYRITIDFQRNVVQFQKP